MLANRRKMKNIYIIFKYFIPGDLARQCHEETKKERKTYKL